MRFDNKVAIITGGASGIGLATAIGFAARGGSVVIADYNIDGANAAALEINALGGKAHSLRMDVTSGEDILATVKFTADTFGRIDFLHNNAFAPWRGDGQFGLTGEVGDKQWDHVLNAGLTSVFRFTRAVLPIMLQQKSGAIVNTSSTAGFHPEPHTLAYSAAKAGVIQVSRSTAIEYGRYGIRCNAICPGVISTPLIKGAPLDDNFMMSIPAGRLGTAEEIANAVLFLASDLASYITGAVLVADGGRTV